MLMSPVTKLVRAPAARVFARSMFTAKKHEIANIKWFNVSLAMGTSVGLWVMLIKQRSEDMAEYKRRNGLE